MAHAIVVGAGPAGASLAFLLADRGLEVVLVERQHDFAREFRGEVLMPSGVEALEQMGLGGALAQAPQWTIRSVALYLNRSPVIDAALDPSSFDGHPPLAISQPGLLEAIVAEGARRPGFRFLRGASARELLREDGRVVGVRVHTDAGHEDLRARLVVGSDGRASVVRRRSELRAAQKAPPMDIVWCKLPPLPGLDGALGFVGHGHVLLAYRTFGDQLQLGWAILKGTFGELRKRGIEQWIEEMAAHATPELGAHLRAHVAAARHPFLLDVVSDRVTPWSVPGALVIGDAAHTMSPVGGQGLNLALRDALVAANHLVPALRAGGAAEAVDAAARAIEAERLPEIALVQRIQGIAPRIGLSVRWWGEPVRGALARLVRSPLGARLGLLPARLFAFGAKDAKLTV